MGGCETTPPDPTQTPGDSHPTANPAGNHNPAGFSSLLIIGRRLPASSCFVLARAPPGRSRCGRSSLTHGPRGGTTRQLRGNPAQQSHPGDPQQVTGPARHALLTEGSPMGWFCARLAYGTSAAPSRLVPSAACRRCLLSGRPGRVLDGRVYCGLWRPKPVRTASSSGRTCSPPPSLLRRLLTPPAALSLGPGSNHATRYCHSAGVCNPQSPGGSRREPRTGRPRARGYARTLPSAALAQLGAAAVSSCLASSVRVATPSFR
jgi:hypothetical protein